MTGDMRASGQRTGQVELLNLLHDMVRLGKEQSFVSASIKRCEIDTR